MNNYLIIMPWLIADRLFRLCFIQHSAAISKRYTAATYGIPPTWRQYTGWPKKVSHHQFFKKSY